MKHLYKTKEGEIFEVKLIDYEDNSIVYGEYNDRTRLDLSEVQEVVLDKDGEPFMFEGEVVCVGDYINGKKVIDFTFGNTATFLTVKYVLTELLFESEIKSHTPKHPQKKGIEKIELNHDYYVEARAVGEKLNEVIELVNNLKE